MYRYKIKGLIDWKLNKKQKTPFVKELNKRINKNR